MSKTIIIGKGFETITQNNSLFFVHRYKAWLEVEAEKRKAVRYVIAIGTCVSALLLIWILL